MRIRHFIGEIIAASLPFWLLMAPLPAPGASDDQAKTEPTSSPTRQGPSNPSTETRAPDRNPALDAKAKRTGRPAVGKREVSGERFLVRYRPLVDPIPLNQPFSLHLDVFEADAPNAPARDVTVAVTGWMPEHRHGMSLRPRVEGPHPDGTWTAHGMLFHMPGWWQLFVDVSRNKRKERAVFDIDIE